MHRLALLVLPLLAACPPRPQGPQGPQQGQEVGVAGCPAAQNIYVASFVVNEPGKGRSGWVSPAHAMKVDATATVPDYAPLDATTAAASGVPPAPAGTAWLVTPSAPPCKATIGSYYTAKIDGPPASLSYGFEIDGCPAPPDPQEAGGLLMISDVAPAGCRIEVPQPIAARLGDETDNSWHRPTKETPIPPSLASQIPPHECTSPACEELWAISQILVNGRPIAWAGAVNWLHVGDPAKPCDWPAERFSGFFVPGQDGTPVKVTEGQDKPLVLTAALVDGNGAKALLAEGPGEYATYDLAGGAAKLARHVTWSFEPDEAWSMVDHLGPICGQPGAQPGAAPAPAGPQAQPAPLPKDAKPISPYP